jgi:hypothetical protein
MEVSGQVSASVAVTTEEWSRYLLVGGCVGVRGGLDPLPGIELLLGRPSNP